MINSQPRDNRGPLGTQLNLLSNSERRALLCALAEADEDRTDGHRPLDLIGRPDASERLRIELYHSHLPKLAANGLVDWDSDAGTIRKGPNWEAVVPLLELLTSHREQLPKGAL